MIKINQKFYKFQIFQKFQYVFIFIDATIKAHSEKCFSEKDKF
jgi:hypothetical protein